MGRARHMFEELKKLYNIDFKEEDAKRDIIHFKLILKKFPELKEQEKKVFEQLCNFSEISTNLFGITDKELLIFYVGVVTAAYDFYIGTLWALSKGNSHVTCACMRQLIETLAIIYHCTKKPEYITIINSEKNEEKASTLLEELSLDTKYSKVYATYKRLSKIVHLTRKSILTNFLTINDERITHVPNESPALGKKTIEALIKDLIFLTDATFIELNNLYKINKTK
jgi:hypothetical protein